MQMMRAALVAVLFSTSCTCRDNVRTSAVTSTTSTVASPQDAATGSGTRDAQQARAVDSAATQALRQQPLQPSDDKVLAALPTISGGTVVRPGRRLFNETQWFAVSCGPSGTFELLRNNLRDQGWREESQRDSDGIQTVTAQRAGLGVSIIVKPSKSADCAGTTASITGFRLAR